MTRWMLSAKADRLISARTLVKPLTRQWAGSFQGLMVPNGCSTICLRGFINPGFAATLCCIFSSRCSCPQRVMRRPSLLRVHGALITQVRQAVVA